MDPRFDSAPVKLKIKLEGNFDCFAKAYDCQCKQIDGLWRSDYLSQSNKRIH